MYFKVLVITIITIGVCVEIWFISNSSKSLLLNTPLKTVCLVCHATLCCVTTQVTPLREDRLAQLILKVTLRDKLVIPIDLG